MDSFTTLRVLLSRWYIVVPCLLLTAAITIVALRAVPPTYDAKGTLVLLPPATEQITPENATEVRVNPWLEMGLDRLANILSQSAGSAASADRLAAQGATATFEVTTGTDLDAPGNGTSPVINIVANHEDPAVAQQTVTALFSGITAELNQRQQEQQVPEDQLIGTEQITTPDQVSQQVGNKMRGGAVAFALGVALTFGLAFMAESMSERRHRSRADRSGPLRRVPAAPPPQRQPVDGRSRSGRGQIPPPQQAGSWPGGAPVPESPPPSRRSSRSSAGRPSPEYGGQPYADQRPPGVSPSHPSWPPIETAAPGHAADPGRHSGGGRSSSGSRPSGGSRSSSGSSRPSGGGSRSGSAKSRSPAGDSGQMSEAASWLSAIDPTSDSPRSSSNGRGGYASPSTPPPATTSWSASSYSSSYGSSPTTPSGYPPSGTPSTPAGGSSGYPDLGDGTSGYASAYGPQTTAWSPNGYDSPLGGANDPGGYGYGYGGSGGYQPSGNGDAGPKPPDPWLPYGDDQSPGRSGKHSRSRSGGN